MFKAAETVAPWSIIQSRVQHNWGCTQAGPGSPSARAERWAAAGREAAEGTPAGPGRTQPGCKASGGEGSRGQLGTERKHSMRRRGLKIFRQ